MLGAEPLGGPCDLAVAAREVLDQPARDTGDLEVLAVLARPLLDRITLLGKLLRQRRAVEGSDLTRATEHGTRADRDDPVILTHRPRDHDMAVQLRVRRLSAGDTPGCRVAVGGRDHILRVLFDHLAVVAATHDRHPLLQVADRSLDRPGVRRFDLLALPRIAQRPHDRHRLRRAERHVDPTAAVAVCTRRTQPATGRQGRGLPSTPRTADRRPARSGRSRGAPASRDQTATGRAPRSARRPGVR